MTDINNPSAITPEIVQEWAIDIKEVMACYLPEMEEAVPFLLKENLKLHEENQQLRDEVDVCYKPCFFAVVDYVQKYGAKWNVKYLGRSCHEVIIDRCETLQKENQHLHKKMEIIVADGRIKIAKEIMLTEENQRLRDIFVTFKKKIMIPVPTYYPLEPGQTVGRVDWGNISLIDILKEIDEALALTH